MPNASKVKDAVGGARPVVERLAKDEKFRRNVAEAYGSARTIYDQIGDDKTVKAIAAKLASDPQLQKEIRKTVGEVQKAAKHATKKSHKKRNALVMAGIVIGLLYNPATGSDTRKWLKERVFGSDETFEYEGLSG